MDGPKKAVSSLFSVIPSIFFNKLIFVLIKISVEPWSVDE